MLLSCKDIFKFYSSVLTLPAYLLNTQMDEDPHTNGEVLDKPEASKLLKISTRTLDDWMRRRRVPYSKLPSGTVRFRRSQLLQFIAKYQVAS